MFVYLFAQLCPYSYCKVYENTRILQNLVLFCLKQSLHVYVATLNDIILSICLLSKKLIFRRTLKMVQFVHIILWYFNVNCTPPYLNYPFYFSVYRQTHLFHKSRFWKLYTYSWTVHFNSYSCLVLLVKFWLIISKNTLGITMFLVEILCFCVKNISLIIFSIDIIYKILRE